MARTPLSVFRRANHVSGKPQPKRAPPCRLSLRHCPQKPAVPRSGEAGTFRKPQSWPVLFLEARDWHCNCKSWHGIASADSWQERCRRRELRGRNRSAFHRGVGRTSFLILRRACRLREISRSNILTAVVPGIAPRVAGLPGRHVATVSQESFPAWFDNHHHYLTSLPTHTSTGKCR